MAYIEIELYDIETVELQEELERRGYSVSRGRDLPTDDESVQLQDLYEAKLYHPEKFDQLFSDYIWRVLGKQV